MRSANGRECVVIYEKRMEISVNEKAKKRMNLNRVLVLVIGSLLGVSFVGSTGVMAASAPPLPTVAIIDVGVNASLFTNIVTEVCIVEMLACPNGKQFMEGKGAADTGVSKNKSIDHGTNMVSIVTKVNPKVGIIPIRIVSTTTNGSLGLYSNKAVKSALDWVLSNQAKFNIVAVSVSQGKVFKNCSVPDGTAKVIDDLRAKEVAVIAAAGNDRNQNEMMSIACLPNAISIGATDNPDPGVGGIAFCRTCEPTIARYSNGNPTYYLNGRWYVTQGDGSTKFTVGTSNATSAFAAWWTLNFKGTIQSTFEWMNSVASIAKNPERVGKYISLPETGK